MRSLAKRVAELEAREASTRTIAEPTDEEMEALAILRHDMRIERGSEVTDEIRAELRRRLVEKGVPT